MTTTNTSKSFFVNVAQFPISLNIQENLSTMLQFTSNTWENEVVLFPEGALSGYDLDPTFLQYINIASLEAALETLQKEVIDRKIHLIFGSCLKIDNEWFNAGLYFSHNASPFVYHKVNLATSERGSFKAGNNLSIFEMNINNNLIKAGMQLCREIRFPEQWQQLARSGAEAFFYLTNAVGDNRIAPVWRSHLISRAAENQRFVIAANNAHKAQKCPSMIIEPTGNVIKEVFNARKEYLRAKVEISEISNWYLNQARTDVVKLVSKAT